MRADKFHRVNKTKTTNTYFKWFAITIILGSFYVWQRIESRKLGYRISEINGKIALLTEENKYLTMKIMSITSMNNLEEIAKKRLGLIAPRSSDIVIIKESK